MKPQLVPNWRAVLTRAWSIRLVIAAGILSGCEVALPIIDQFITIPRGTFAALTGLVTCGALISRLVAQENLKDKPNADQ